MSAGLMSSAAVAVTRTASLLFSSVRDGASARFAAVRALHQEYHIARAAIRDYETLLRCGVPADKAVDDVFISHYAVRQPYVPPVSANPERYAWPVQSPSAVQPTRALPTAA